MDLSNIASFNVLNDKGILDAIKKGLISIEPEPEDGQIQPGTLDVKVGQTFVYDEEVRRNVSNAFSKITEASDLGYAQMLGAIDDVLEGSQSFAKSFPDKENTSIFIPSRAFAEIYLHEKIRVDSSKFDISYELRSSRGRLGFGTKGFFLKENGGNHFIEVMNLNPNPIIIYGGSKIAQLFFHPKSKRIKPNGATVTDPEAIRRILPSFDGEVTKEGYMVFRLGKEIRKYKQIGVIDTAQRQDENTLLDKISLADEYVLLPDDAIIAQLEPELGLPENVGIRLMSRIPFNQYAYSEIGFGAADCDQVNAGWVDPGYKGHITAHPFRLSIPNILRIGDAFVYGVLYYYPKGVRRRYGDSSLDSHYQNSKGATSSKS